MSSLKLLNFADKYKLTQMFSILILNEFKFILATNNIFLSCSFELSNKLKSQKIVLAVYCFTFTVFFHKRSFEV